MSARRVDRGGAASREAPRGGSDVERLQAEIEATRADLGATVEALAAKVDVKARARQKVAELRERTSLRARRTVDEVGASGARTRESVGGSMSGTDLRALVIAAGAAVAGFVLFLGISRWWRR